MKYYFLVAYLPEIHPDDRKLKYRLADLFGEKFQIAPEDWLDIELLLLAGDILQIERLLSGKDTAVEFTLYGRDFWKDQIKSPKEAPEWLSEFFEDLAARGFSARNMDRLYCAYFDFAIQKATNPFLRAYLLFERDLRNILSAVRARRKRLPPAEYLVGESDLVDLLGRSSADDFGVRKDYDWIEQILDAESPQEIEQTVQRIRWETVDAMIEPNQFEFDVILAYLVKLQILERNLALSKEQGLDIVKRLEEF
jgi:hypothetical protein